MADIEIDGQVYSVNPGDNLLKACLELGFDLPYFCWHPALGSVGACRQCAVIQYQNAEDTRGRLVMACMTPVADGALFSLQAPQAREFRAGIVELLMTNHPHDCPVCEEGGECHLQDMTEMTGHTFRSYRGTKRTHRNQNLGPCINHEMNRCIACYRCVRYYQDYCGGQDLQVFAAHNHVYFGRHQDGTLENEFSGNLVEVCPTGVFTDKTFSRHYTRKWDLQTAPSICPHCSLGCNTSPGERYGTLRRIVNRYHGEINGYFLCDRGRFGYDFVNSDRRIRQSRIRNQPPMGIKGVGNLFGNLLRQSKGVIGIGSPRASLEANFALRELVGAANFHMGIADTEYAAMQAVIAALSQGSVRIATLRQVEQADAVLVLGEDVSNTAPRLALALRQAARNHGAAAADQLKIPRWQDAAVRTVGQGIRTPLFVASFAATRLDDIATGVHRGGPDAIARLGEAIAQRLNDSAFVAGKQGANGLSSNAAHWSFEAMADTIAAALIGAERPLIVSGTGCQSPAIIAAAAGIAGALSARREGKPVDVHFVAPECNSLGLAMMGGGNLNSAFCAIDEGRAEAVVILENDLYRRAPRGRVDDFLAKTRHLIVLDHLTHETAQQAELVLAAATYAESEGTWVSSEGRAQRYFAVFPPTGEVQKSWRWLSKAQVSKWGHLDELTAQCAATLAVFGEIIQAAPSAGARINGQKIPRQPHRYSGRTAMLANRTIQEPKQPVDPESPLAFSMEGAHSDHTPALNPFTWAPGWNSTQSVNKFQDEIGGHLRGGDPGIRLIEPGTIASCVEAAPKALDMMPPASASSGFQFAPLYDVFGSEELSGLSDAVVARSQGAYLALNAETMEKLGLQPGDEVPVKLAGATLQLPVQPLNGLAEGLAGIPVGLPGVSWSEFEGRYWEPGE